MIRKLATIGNGVCRWRIELRMPKGYTKPRVNQTFDATEAEAHAIHAELLGIRARGKAGLPIKASAGLSPKLGECCATYESHMRAIERTPDYITDVLVELEHLKRRVGESMPINAITRQHILEWVDYRRGIVWRKKKPSARTINKALAMVRRFFVFCQKVTGWIETNPADLPKTKEVKPLPKILSWKDYLAFSEAAWRDRPVFAVFVEVLAESGARVEELCAAKVKDIDINRRIWRKEVKPGRILELDAKEWTLWCATGRNPEAPLCPNEVGKRWHYETIRNAFVKYRGVTTQPNLMPHYLRHGRACWMLAEGINAHRVKEFLGHATIVTTEHYLRAAEQLRREEEPGTVHSKCQNVPKSTASAFYDSQPTALLHKGSKGFKRSSQKGLKRK